MEHGGELRIRTLGGFAVSRGEHALVWPTRKAAALLAVLASRPGVLFTRERVAGLLWGRSADAQARGSLRQALAQLRRTLGDDRERLVESTVDALRLAAEGVRVDTAELDAAVADGGVGALERAAALYGGEFLAGFTLAEPAFDEWRQFEAERVRRVALGAMSRLFERYVADEALERASALAERMLAIEPASEDVYRGLMRLHLARGALGSAMREYERCKSALASLGVPPSAATDALRRQIRAAPTTRETAKDEGVPLIAVLPFANLSDDAEQGFFARGFTEDVIRELSRFRPLRVISSHSSFASADAQGSPAEIGARLGARYVLTGSVRRGAASIRVGAELLDGESGHFLWSGRYDIAPSGIFDAHDEIGRAVAATLVSRIDDDRVRRAARQPLADLAVYDCWLRGVAALRRASPASHAEARILFERALELDPSFARAYSGLSLTYFNEWSCLAWDRWAENESRAFEYAQRGAQMDDGDPVTHFILGRILLYRRQFDRADRHLQRAELLNPNDADLLAQLAVSDTLLGRADAGVAHARLAMRLNPFHDDWYFAFASAPHLFAGRIETAIEYALKAPDVATDAHAYLACASGHLGRREDAARHLALFDAAYRQNISPGREPLPDEAVRWLMHVNPFRRAEDAAFFLDGLARAGLAVPADLLQVA